MKFYLDRDELIPFFGDDEEKAKERAFETIEKNDRLKFYKNPDLTLATVNAKLVFNRVCGR